MTRVPHANARRRSRCRFAGGIVTALALLIGLLVTTASTTGIAPGKTALAAASCGTTNIALNKSYAAADSKKSRAIR